MATDFPTFWLNKNEHLVERRTERVERNERLEGGEVVVYKVFYKDYDLKRGILLGMLKERRKDLRGRSPLESGLRWARVAFGHRVADKNGIFVVPRELAADIRIW